MRKKKNPPLKIEFANDSIYRMQFGLTFKLTLSSRYANCVLPKTMHCRNASYSNFLNTYYEGFNEHKLAEIKANGEEISEAIKIIAYKKHKTKKQKPKKLKSQKSTPINVMPKNSTGLIINLKTLQSPNYNFKQRKKWLSRALKNMKKYSPKSFIKKKNRDELKALVIFASSVKCCYLQDFPHPKIRPLSFAKKITEQEKFFKQKHP